VKTRLDSLTVTVEHSAGENCVANPEESRLQPMSDRSPYYWFHRQPRQHIVLPEGCFSKVDQEAFAILAPPWDGLGIIQFRHRESDLISKAKVSLFGQVEDAAGSVAPNQRVQLIVDGHWFAAQRSGEDQSKRAFPGHARYRWVISYVVGGSIGLLGLALLKMAVPVGILLMLVGTWVIFWLHGLAESTPTIQTRRTSGAQTAY